MTTEQLRSPHEDAIRAAAMVVNPVAFEEAMKPLWFAKEAEEKAEQIVAAYFASRGWTMPSKFNDDRKPIAHLVWLQSFNGIDDVHDYYEVARPGDKCVDGSPPFPVWDRPVHFPAAPEGGPSQDSKEHTNA